MPWVRYDDDYPNHPKVAPLTDRLYRLHTSAIFWCAHHLTDGVIRVHLLEQIHLRPRTRPVDANRLVDAGLFHRAGDAPCPSEACPHDGRVPDGWIIHDYWDYQPRRSAVERERKDRADRQRRWRERRRARNASTRDSGDASTPPLRNAPVDAAPYPYPPRPVPPRPEGSGGGTPPRRVTAWGGPPPPAVGADVGGRDPERLARLAAGVEAARSAIRKTQRSDQPEPRGVINR